MENACRKLLKPMPEDNRLSQADAISSPLLIRPSKYIHFAHIGRSMNPILIEHDLLEVLPYNDKPIRAGDVVAFQSPLDGTIFAHRVTAVLPEGIKTSGDNNRYEDPWCLHRTAIIGKVNAAIRHRQRRRVHGGFKGQMFAKLSHWRYKLSLKGIYFLYPFYQFILNQRILTGIGALFIRPRVVVFKAKDTSNIILLSGKRMIGQYSTDRNRWHIGRFYRLFIDESTLPNFDNVEENEH